ncbi:tryptophan synthase beta subunit-like PLP-dependent enzyme [Triangularia setosa]|uniref:Tryptophan synthase beta subunit-like PLP-dependent enzyme n=1 Tax=Triangularia setosa TaxID=2587417 RepID=A0AAN6W7B5_9PEZI|nr:tryptophan synthase beta subunit-like PLP-dependent enzyme [Podospora setosa]
MSLEIYLNPSASSWRYTSPNNKPDTKSQIRTFHSLLPSYAPTPLYPLTSIAKTLGIKQVYLKSEAYCLGLPSFKILGASWAVYRTVLDFIGVNLNPSGQPLPSSEEIKSVTKDKRLENVKIITATDGNWGRAARAVFVSEHMHPTTRELIGTEGVRAEVKLVKGDYYRAVGQAKVFGEEGKGEERLLVMDMSWEGYERVPGGYTNMPTGYDTRILQQTGGGGEVTHAVVPCGCGSIARAVTQYFKDAVRVRSGAKVVAVEPDSAVCLQASLQNGEMTTVQTGDETIMCGMNVGTLSSSAWEVLGKWMNASVVVTDKEAHQVVADLESEGVEAGPCGAATLAGLRRICADDSAREGLGLGSDAVVVLFCTEGKREYEAPT